MHAGDSSADSNAPSLPPSRPTRAPRRLPRHSTLYDPQAFSCKGGGWGLWVGTKGVSLEQCPTRPSQTALRGGSTQNNSFPTERFQYRRVVGGGKATTLHWAFLGEGFGGAEFLQREAGRRNFEDNQAKATVFNVQTPWFHFLWPMQDFNPQKTKL